jgi:hypothetical protein
VAGDPARAGLNPAAGSPFANNGVIPNGAQVGFIQNSATSSLSTMISRLKAGTAYKVTFRVNARNGQTPNLKVDIDGNNIINTAVTSVGGANPYKYFAFDFTASAESQTLTLRNDAGGDHTVLVDDFKIAASNSGWSYAAWTDDATSGVDGSKAYTHAYNFGSAAGTTINGVAFTGVAGGNPTVAGRFSTTGLGSIFVNDANNVTGGSRTLANDFIYNGFPATITIDNLLIGAEYVATIYSIGWENGTRAATFSVGDDRLTVNQDHFGDNNGIRFVYRYVATSTSITLTYLPLQGNSIHTYGFSNQEFSVPPSIPPTIVDQPQDVIVGLGDTATFAVSAAGSPPLTYQWYFGGFPLSGQTDTMLSVPTGFGDEGGDYFAVVENGSGSVTSRVARLTLRAKVPGLFNTGVDASGVALADGAVDPHYSLIVNADGPSSDAIVENSQACPIVTGPWLANTAGTKWIGPTFETTNAAGLAEGNGIYVYRTTFDLTGMDLPSVVITGGWASDNAGLSIKINGIATGLVNNNGFGGLNPFTIDSANASFVDGVNTLDFEVQNEDVIEGYTGLYVSNLRGLAELPGTPPEISTQPQTQLAGTGESVTFTVVASGSSPISYQWRKGGADILGANAASYSIQNVTKDDAGTYSVYVSNPVGDATSDDAELTVRDTVPGLYNTGVDDTKFSLVSGSVDPHWKITQSADPAFPGPDAYVLNDTGFPIPPWLANDEKSKWIAPQADQSVGNLEGDYNYQLTFNLAGFDPASVRITGEWATDNTGIDILINGTSTGQANENQFVLWTPFQIDSGFVAGLNTIDFKMNNAPSAINPTGFRVRNLRALGDTLPAGTPAFIVTHPTDVTAELGEFVTFQVGANGSTPLEYQWFIGPDALPGETGPTLSFVFDFPDLVGDYSVRVSNPFGSETSTVATLRLPLVNQPPSFTKGPDVTVAEDSGPHTIAGWATQIQSGPAEETPQGLTFLITSDNSALFASGPAIDSSSGALTFGLAPNANGAANITVVLMDDGGTDNGGNDSSAPETFVINVTPVNDCPLAGSGDFSTDEDQAVSIPASIIIDPDGGPFMAITVVAPPAHGTVEPIYVISTGSVPPGQPILVGIIYSPEPNFNGTDTFTYRAGDGLCVGDSVGTINITVRPVNDAPTAKIVVTPLTTLEGVDNPVVISGNNVDACVVLDGSLSSDVEPGPLTYAWVLDASPIPFSTEAVTGQCLEIGVHTILLAVADGDGATGTTSETVEVITAGEAVELLVALVNESTIERKNKRPFIATLKAAGASFDRGNNISAANQLQAFQNKVRAQVGTDNPADAMKWIRLAQAIAGAVTTE